MPRKFRTYTFVRKALNLTESDIRFAMAHSHSNNEAAKFIGCDVSAYARYAKRYIDSETGKTLWDLHKNIGRKGFAKLKIKDNSPSILDVLEGKNPKFPAKDLKAKVLQEGLMTEECAYCGFNERRITDGSVPLVMVWKDGDITNHLRENLELVCYNHYFLMYNDVFMKAEAIDKKCKGYYD